MPGRAYPVTIELYPTSLVFAKGHKIRLDISSSNFPRFDVNPNSYEPEGLWRTMRKATNTVFCEAARPSHLRLPVIAT